MTQEELVQENEKLNQRLAKAIEVFKEQKENIARLTKERDEAREILKKVEIRVDEISKQLEEKSEGDEKFFEQLNEIQVLEKRIDKLENDYEVVTEKNAQLVSDNQRLNESLEYNKAKLKEATSSNTNLTKQLKQAQEEIEGLNADYDAEQAKVQELEQVVEDSKKTVEEQHDTIENLTNALDKLNSDIQKERAEYQEFMGRLIDKEGEIHNLSEELHNMLTTAAG